MSASEPSLARVSDLKRKWGIYTPGELKQRCSELQSGTAIIDGLIRHRSLSIVAGDSGLGKSPLFYQAALCVAAGRPFLGRDVCTGRVLYLDFENGLGDVDDLVARLMRHLSSTPHPIISCFGTSMTRPQRGSLSTSRT